MSRRLVFVHGRAQENKDSIALKAEWLNAFREGLGKNGLALPIPEQDIRFPYYGQTLYDLVRGIPDDQITGVVVRGDGADQDEQDFIAEYVGEVQTIAGISDDDVRAEIGDAAVQRGVLNWEWVQGILGVIDRRVPGGSGTAIALATNDVYKYLRNPGIRDVIEAGIRQAMVPGVETVVVGHSLGTIAAYQLLRREGKDMGWKVPLFVTLGSPLAVTAVKKSLRPVTYPECVSSWFNAMDPRDVVSLYPLDGTQFPINPAIVNKTDIDNHTTNRHGITGYLNDSEVARVIHAALTA